MQGNCDSGGMRRQKGVYAVLQAIKTFSVRSTGLALVLLLIWQWAPWSNGVRAFEIEREPVRQLPLPDSTSAREVRQERRWLAIMTTIMER
jgi:hypothetical protein